VPLLPNTELVAMAWLRLAVEVGVATTLPSDVAPLRTSGFVRVATIGGSPNRDVPMRAPVVAAECWAAPSTPGSSKPPWNRANGIAEQVVAATYDPALMGVLVDLSGVGDYSPARVHTVVALTEPRRIENDPGNFGRYDIDLLLSWTSAA
jgi:hypothetical protein